METWANLNVLVRAEEPYISPEERRRLERVEVGRICRCGDCVCCREYAVENRRVNTCRVKIGEKK